MTPGRVSTTPRHAPGNLIAAYDAGTNGCSAGARAAGSALRHTATLRHTGPAAVIAANGRYRPLPGQA